MALSISGRNSSQDSCSICLEDFKWSLDTDQEKVVALCNHAFHRVCMFDWVTTPVVDGANQPVPGAVREDCPLCRQKLDLLCQEVSVLCPSDHLNPGSRLGVCGEGSAFPGNEKTIHLLTQKEGTQLWFYRGLPGRIMGPHKFVILSADNNFRWIDREMRSEVDSERAKISEGVLAAPTVDLSGIDFLPIQTVSVRCPDHKIPAGGKLRIIGEGDGLEGWDTALLLRRKEGTDEYTYSALPGTTIGAHTFVIVCPGPDGRLAFLYEKEIRPAVDAINGAELKSGALTAPVVDLSGVDFSSKQMVSVRCPADKIPAGGRLGIVGEGDGLDGWDTALHLERKEGTDEYFYHPVPGTTIGAHKFAITYSGDDGRILFLYEKGGNHLPVNQENGAELGDGVLAAPVVDLSGVDFLPLQIVSVHCPDSKIPAGGRLGIVGEGDRLYGWDTALHLRRKEGTDEYICNPSPGTTIGAHKFVIMCSGSDGRPALLYEKGERPAVDAINGAELRDGVLVAPVVDLSGVNFSPSQRVRVRCPDHKIPAGGRLGIIGEGDRLYGWDTALHLGRKEGTDEYICNASLGTTIGAHKFVIICSGRDGRPALLYEKGERPAVDAINGAELRDGVLVAPMVDLSGVNFSPAQRVRVRCPDHKIPAGGKLGIMGEGDGLNDWRRVIHLRRVEGSNDEYCLTTNSGEMIGTHKFGIVCPGPDGHPIFLPEKGSNRTAVDAINGAELRGGVLAVPLVDLSEVDFLPSQTVSVRCPDYKIPAGGELGIVGEGDGLYGWDTSISLRKKEGSDDEYIHIAKPGTTIGAHKFGFVCPGPDGDIFLYEKGSNRPAVAMENGAELRGGVLAVPLVDLSSIEFSE